MLTLLISHWKRDAFSIPDFQLLNLHGERTRCNVLIITVEHNVSYYRNSRRHLTTLTSSRNIPPPSIIIRSLYEYYIQFPHSPSSREPVVKVSEVENGTVSSTTFLMNTTSYLLVPTENPHTWVLHTGCTDFPTNPYFLTLFGAKTSWSLLKIHAKWAGVRIFKGWAKWSGSCLEG